MSLAILKYNGNINGSHRFTLDIGTNTCFQFKIGEETRKNKGLSFVDKISFTSKLLERNPLQDVRTEFEIDLKPEMFDRDKRFIQLYSFKNKKKESPAISEVISVRPSVLDISNLKLPEIMYHIPFSIDDCEVTKASYNIREPSLSEAKFFGALLGALPGIIGQAAPVIGQLIPGLKNAMPVVEKVVKTAAPALKKITETKDDSKKAEVATQVAPDILKAILEVVNSINEKKDNTLATGKSLYSSEFSINPHVLLDLAPILEKILSAETIKAIGDQPEKLYKAIIDSTIKLNHSKKNGSPAKIPPATKHNGEQKPVSKSKSLAFSFGNSGYSQAQIAPAVLAALPALMPILKQAISPEMVKAVGDQPVKLFKAISDSVLKMDQQEMAHLEKINPGVDDPSVERILASMSIPTSTEVAIPFKTNTSVSIKFVEAKTIKVGGRDKVVYSMNDKISIPVQLITKKKGETVKTVPKAIMQLVIQDGDSMKVLFEKKYKLTNVPLNTTIEDVVLVPEEMVHLPQNKDLKIELSFIWIGTKGDKQGTFKNHYICLTDGYLFKRLDAPIDQHFVLNDVDKNRKYWHKVWEGGISTHPRWKIELECKYYYTLNHDDTQIKVLDTKRKLIADSAKEKNSDGYRRHIKAKIKSGIEISLEAYNQLLTSLTGESLTTEQLNALKNSEFTKDSELAARVSVDFRGKTGETATLWTYPEVNICQIVLEKVSAFNAAGQAVSTQEEQVKFPKFSSVHFIGTQSE